MSILENIALAFSSLRANKMRALLTMLGIIIGISSVIAIITLGNSLTGSITGSMQGLGVGNITLSIQSKQNAGRGMGGGMMSAVGGGMMGAVGGIDERHLISDAMLDELRAAYPDEIEGISLSEQVGSGQTTAGRKYANLSLTGVNPEYADTESLTLTGGRFISQRDQEGRKKIAVVSDKLVSNMFGAESPLGRQITVVLNGGTVATYTIVGVYEYSASYFGMSTANDKDVSTPVYIPLSAAQKMSGTGGYSSATLVVAAGVNATSFVDTVTGFFDKYYSRNEEYGVSAFSMETIIESLTDMLNTVSIAIAAIAAISLLVGGIGVMNIMMVSITERTREIGTRKAIGATNAEIRVQFIVEAVVICLVGGIIGIVLGVVLGMGGASLMGYPGQASAGVILLAAGFSMAIGVFFGYYPANKAAKLDPIEALRYE